jgi:hypothetical protein
MRTNPTGSKLLAVLIQQRKTGYWIGGAKDLLTRVFFYVTALNFILLAATAYNTTLREPLHEWFPWLTFPLFLAILAIVLAFSMVLEYKLVLPSTIAYLNQQGYKHQNPIREQLDRIENELRNLRNDIGDGMNK